MQVHHLSKTTGSEPVVIHCGKKHRKFPSQVTDAADHNTPVTENSGIKFPTSLLDCSAIYIGIYFRNIFRNLDKFNMICKKKFKEEGIQNSNFLLNCAHVE